MLLWGHNSVKSSSITVNDSLDCSHWPYGHGTRIKNKKYDVLAEILRNYEKFPVIFLQQFLVMIRHLLLLTMDLRNSTSMLRILCGIIRCTVAGVHCCIKKKNVPVYVLSFS